MLTVAGYAGQMQRGTILRSKSVVVRHFASMLRRKRAAFSTMDEFYATVDRQAWDSLGGILRELRTDGVLARCDRDGLGEALIEEIDRYQASRW